VMLQRGSGCSPTAEASSCFTRGGMPYEIRQVHYAQHEKVVVYSWKTLQEQWSQPNMRRWAADAGHRPLVFVALSSHASYAMPCNDRARCLQIVHAGIPERRNGDLAWANNHECIDDCVKPLPAKGGRPSDWNAVKARWGTQHCILFGTVCDTQMAPAAPAFQERYRDPCPAEPDAKHCLFEERRF
jgi:hypothetical protein